MIREAEENAESDKLRKEEADLKNECEQIIFSAKKSIKDLGDDVTEQEKQDIEAKSKELEEALKGQDLEDIKKKKEELLKVSQNVAMRAYQKAQKANEANHSSTDEGSSGSDDAVDAEYEDSSN
jgi:molecular chaperone DnaK